MATKVICISGKAGHGKDTFAGYLKAYLETHEKRVLIAHYGDQVKYICRQFFDWDGKKDEHGRSLLQRVGTDVVRKKKPRHWVDRVLEILEFFPDEWDYVLIPDCRFPDEIQRVMECGFDTLHVRIVRPGYEGNLTEEQKKHISETALDDSKPDALIRNSGTHGYVGLLAEAFADEYLLTEVQ